MPSTYYGNPTAAQSPSPAPSPSNVPALQLPNDGEPVTASAFGQAFKVCADWLAWLIYQYISAFRGVRQWVATTTYAVNDLVLNPSDNLLYRSLTGPSLNLNPASNPSDWERVGHTDDQVQHVAVKVTNALTGITCTPGSASVARTYMFAYLNEAVRRIEFAVANVPANGSVVVDLSASTTKFVSFVHTGQATLLSGSYPYGGEVGLELNYGGNVNQVRVWWKRGAGDGTGYVTVGVTISGD